MASHRRMLANSWDDVYQGLSSAVAALVEAGDRSIPLEDLAERFLAGCMFKEGLLEGALAILATLGLVRIDRDTGTVRGTSSKRARYALASLSKFLGSAASPTGEPLRQKDEDYLASLTRVLESVRCQSPLVDHDPLHQRRIVNILIKSRITRKWKKKDAYLHVYHPEWKQYHLVGVGDEETPIPDEELAERALAKHLKLYRDEYELDQNLNPTVQEYVLVSEPNGVLTRYTIRLFVAKHIRVKTPPKDLVAKHPDRFRWFTWEEINEGRGEQGEVIMHSTARMMRSIDLESVRIAIARANDARRRVGIIAEWSNRVTWAESLLLGAALAASGLLLLFPDAVTAILSKLGSLSPILENLGNVAQIIGAVIALASLYWAVRKGR